MQKKIFFSRLRCPAPIRAARSKPESSIDALSHKKNHMNKYDVTQQKFHAGREVHLCTRITNTWCSNEEVVVGGQTSMANDSCPRDCEFESRPRLPRFDQRKELI